MGESVDVYRLGQSTASDETFTRISQWIETCNTHQYCSAWRTLTSSSRDSPTRLIKIGADDQCPNPIVKLVEEVDIPSTPAYATLSHCWGGTVPGKLLKVNLEKYRSGIPWHSLARTFQDAVTTAIKLGITFVWIDALCIVQDDEADWNREAEKMAAVYANSIINISADASKTSSGGLFRPRESSRDGAFMVPAKRSSEVLTAFWFYTDDWGPQVECSPLAHRAWVVQERFLAPRVLHFGEHQVYWECAQMSKLESLPVHCTYIRTVANWGMAAIRERLHNAETIAFPCSPQYASWCRLLEVYSDRRLTVPEDRPMALAGLVNAFAKLFGWQPSDYICGLWRQEVAHFLTWFRSSSDCPTAPRNEDFPSWSWLSLKDGVQMCGSGPSRRNYNSVSKALDSNSTAEGTSGLLDSKPTIRIQGPLCRATIWQTNRSSRNPYLRHEEVEDFRMIKVGDASLHQDEHVLLRSDEVTKVSMEENWSSEVFVLLLLANEDECFPEFLEYHLGIERLVIKPE